MVKLAALYCVLLLGTFQQVFCHGKVYSCSKLDINPFSFHQIDFKQINGFSLSVQYINLFQNLSY